ncbi:sensor histidine kinase [Granulicella mallensis]|uniref:Signal transduction histidine kinase/ligand-binding sensor domain-containing protein n=1 Tax=Granulicella mallensis TaxID=940614 RepID=A0A7W7ZM64_9BACT|nr:sensor histidine kinase [Granulicella mallensis]MBB5062505.1 signal transduction histidine kinase/ligand-binding sensor domain-containing protein [Granulicella mallensis]
MSLGVLVRQNPLIDLLAAVSCVAALACFVAPVAFANGARDGLSRAIPASVQDENASDSASTPTARTSNQAVMQESWTVQQGAPEYIQSMAQTADGFLWLGGPGGLFRFDGTRFERFHASSGDQLLSTNVISIFAPTTGGLWVGYEFGGFSFVNSGRVRNYSRDDGAATGTVNGFAEDPKGIVWAGTANGVWEFDHSKWRRLGSEWNGPRIFTRLAFDREGTMWVLTGYDKHKLLYLLPGDNRFEATDDDVTAYGFTLDADHRVITRRMETQHRSSAQKEPNHTLLTYPLFRKDSAQLVDRTNSVWIIASAELPLMRVSTPDDIKAALAKAAPANAETYEVHPFGAESLVDREGNIWFSDDHGIHRFFYIPFVKQRLGSAPGPFAIAAGDVGEVWVATWGGKIPNTYRVVDGKTDALNSVGLGDWTLAYWAPDRTVWFGGKGGLWHLVNGKMVYVALPKERLGDGVYLQAMTTDGSGGLWVSFSRLGLYRLVRGVWTIPDVHSGFPTPDVISEFSDSLGRVWFGYSRGQLASLEREKVKVFHPSDGIRVGTITAIYGRGSQIWIGGEFGLQQFDEGKFHTIAAVNGDWLLGISGIVETADGDLWLNGLSGIIHIRRAEILEALKDPSYRVKGERIGNREGLPGFAPQIRPLPSAIQGSDGRLWFSVDGGLVSLDPKQLRTPPAAPPITIQSVSADDKNYEPDHQLTFPAHTSSVRIEYAAISLSDPDAVRFRVRLQETDANWHEVSTASPVMYRNLPAGHYHFAAAASDINGKWSDELAIVDFSILPAWYQTIWFRAIVVVASLLVLWIVYQFRLQQLERQFQMALDVRVDERTRIARDLHDTLLQSFSALLLRFQAVSNLLPREPDVAKTRMESAIEQASDAIIEGRDALQELRSVELSTIDLGEAVSNFGNELLSGPPREHPPQFRVQIEGTPCILNPIVRDEAYRITAEALRNAIRHSEAEHIEVEIHYDQSQLRIRIRDDGKGIDQSVLNGHISPGHWGLHGMRERATLVAGIIEVWSELGSGSEVELRIPATSAYAKPRVSRWSVLRRGDRNLQNE